MRKLMVYCRIIRRLELKQIFFRIKKIINFKVKYKPRILKKYRKTCKEGCISLYAAQIPFCFPEKEYNLLENTKEYLLDELAMADSIVKNEFCFLNIKHKYDDNVQWNSCGVDNPLWEYYLNYFEYGITLLRSYIYINDEKYIIKLKELINSWIDNTRPGRGAAWEPYPTSRRIVNWLIIAVKLSVVNYHDKTFLNKLINSIINQTEFLYDNLEYDLDNNHLTSNAKTLIWAGIILKEYKEAGKWLVKGEKLLKRRFDKEILADGFQDEGSASYQMLSIQDYLETFLLAEGNQISCGQFLSFQSIEKMVEAFLSIIRPDGKMPLINDTIYGYPLSEKELLAACAAVFNRSDFKWYCNGASLSYVLWLLGMEGYNAYIKMDAVCPDFSSVALETIGYYIMRSGWDYNDTYLIFDCGPMGPEHCPGHGHADALGFELYACGKPLIIDPGVFSYNGELRYLFKSTYSHNTVVVDGKDQSELVGAFRVGRMAKTELIKWTSLDNYDCAAGSHKGYKGINHIRRIEFFKPDKIAISDRVEGKGHHKIEIVFTLSEGLTDIEVIDGKKCRCRYQNILLDIFFETDRIGEICISDAYISGTWNVLVKGKKVVYTINTELPLEVRTKIKVKREG